MSGQAPVGRHAGPAGLGWLIPGVTAPVWAGGASDWLPRMVRRALADGAPLIHLGVDPSAIARLPQVLDAFPPAGTPVDLLLTIGPAFGPTLSEPPRPRVPNAADVGTVRLHVELPLGLLLQPEGSLLVPELEAAEARGRIQSWGVGTASIDPTNAQLVRRHAPRAAWIRGPFNLLSSSETARTIDDLHREGRSVLASDPFAAGHLDGNFLTGSYLDHPPTSPAPDIERLKREWAPVLQLTSLTQSGRTLPGVAVADLKGRPGVRAILVEAHTAEELTRAAGFMAAPALDEAERARVDRLRA